MSKPRTTDDPATGETREKGGLSLGRLARRLAERAAHDPRLKEAAANLRVSAEALRSGAHTRADERLEALIQARQPGEALDPELSDALTQRRREREERQARLLAREKVLAVATTTQERRVLTQALAGAAWAGGERPAPRYTELLDRLAQGDASEEMAVHRAIWALAERHIISVSPHGVVTVVPLGGPVPESAVPESVAIRETMPRKMLPGEAE